MKPADRNNRSDAQIAAPLREAQIELDELRRARIGSAIEAALDRDDLSRRLPTGHSSRRIRFAAGLAAAAVAAIVAWYGVSRPNPVARLKPLIASAPPSPAPALLIPYSRPGAAGVPPSASLIALAGEKARATISGRVRLTLVGPGQVSVLPAAPAGGDVELALDGGRLLVDYDGRAGGTLRVRSPGAVTTVVGTLLAVDVTPFGSRVAVAHGRVRTQDASGRQWQIEAGTNWSSVDGRVTRLADDLAIAMRDHTASWAGTVPAARPAEPVRNSAHATAASLPAPEVNVDLDALYTKAEGAMRSGDIDEARRILETIAARDASGGLGEAALLDLARVSLAQGYRAEARRVLQRLPTPPHDPALAETAEHLRCRARETDGGDNCAAFAAPARPR